MADETKKDEVVETAVEVAETTETEVDAITQKDEEIAKLKEERDNYKNVALKRLGKLPGDADFLEGADEKSGLTVEEQVKKALLENEIARTEQEKDREIKRMAKENAELRLSLKNRPGAGLGSDSGASTEVKDNVFSPAQLEVLKAKAVRLGADPQEFIERAKKNIQSRS